MKINSIRFAGRLQVSFAGFGVGTQAEPHPRFVSQPDSHSKQADVVTLNSRSNDGKIMRLINARKFVNGEQNFFRDRNDNDSFSYAILSHRWEDEEISLQDVQRLDASPDLKERKGYQKVRNACLCSLEYGLLYLWIDTCKCHVPS